MWDFVASLLNLNTKYTTLQAPILTRWWSVGECASSITDNWMIWKTMLPLILNLPTTYLNVATKKVVKSTIDLMESREIRADILLIKIYHKVFLNKFMKYLQRGDQLVNNVPGFQSRLIGTTYYLMHKTLSDLMEEGWKEADEFKPYIDFKSKYLNNEEHVAMDKKLTLMLCVTHTHLSRSILIHGSMSI